ncbi:unnamed protein product [Clonostachys byssicola]|uniref:Uncharacterized protein n=1 Tax=Clonostachys byssicola TaxID=160290 RepID=A0A9N9UY46_9HYPO|nr:unnamed protein product [Clonostachys byssicola]
MHFIKAVASLFALSSCAAAQFSDSEFTLARRELAEAAEEQYLAARDEYIEKRDIFRRAGGNGTCQKAGNGMSCRKYSPEKKMRVHCGPCAKNASPGQYCLCNW